MNITGFLLWHTSAYLHIITMINMNCALWYINCRGIKVASKSLSHDFKAVWNSLSKRCYLPICSAIFLPLHIFRSFFRFASLDVSWLLHWNVLHLHPIHNTEQDLQVEINAQTIAAYRYLWLNLSELLQALGNAYARTYSTYCLFMWAVIVF